MEKEIEKEMEVEVEVEMLEDDVFFAELSKRISLLITDEDEADFGPAQPPAAVPVVPQAFSLAHVPQGASMLAPPAYTLYHHAASYGSSNSSSGNGGDGARTWQQQQCGSKGTGVFIPQSSPGSAHPRKKGKNKGGSNAATHKARAHVGSILAAGAPTERRA